MKLNEMCACTRLFLTKHVNNVRELDVERKGIE